MRKEIPNLVKISNVYGSNLDFVIAGGGNTSFKTGDFLFVKSSGASLANIDEHGFLKINRQKLATVWRKQYPENSGQREAAVLSDLMAARAPGEESKRPSVETLVHDAIPQRYVVHTHPTIVCGLACSQNGAKATESLFGNSVIWMPYTKPGYIFAVAAKNQIERYIKKYGCDSIIIILQNHGLFIGSNSIKGIERATAFVIDKIRAKLKRNPDFSNVQTNVEKASLLAPAVRMLLSDGQNGVVVFRNNREIQSLIRNRKTFASVESAFTPDYIVYCKAKPLFLSAKNSMEEQYRELTKGIKDYQKRNSYLPKIIAVQNVGVFAGSASKKETDVAMDNFLYAVKVSVLSKNFGGPKFMDSNQIDYIDKLDAEAYRRKMAAAFGGPMKLREKISIVTGSAQGFGKGIAEWLIREGANVVIADLNLNLATKNAESLCSQYGKGKALPVKVDVTSEDSVKNMLIDTVLEYGGLDIFINNAGILKAGSLEEMDSKSFDLVTKVNYAAYYICTKYASRYMKIQHSFNKQGFFDIIQINSKSGLAGSNKNFTYAGSKFGGIGLTQSFAMELVEYNIKVNSICPGNFFEGPLWSDPNNGLFVQYLKAKKVPGARTVRDVRGFYESKVPMKRGCSIEDVVKAIFYVIEQKYETGQAVPVTGGQNMLR